MAAYGCTKTLCCLGSACEVEELRECCADNQVHLPESLQEVMRRLVLPKNAMVQPPAKSSALRSARYIAAAHILQVPPPPLPCHCKCIASGRETRAPPRSNSNPPFWCLDHQDSSVRSCRMLHDVRGNASSRLTSRINNSIWHSAPRALPCMMRRQSHTRASVVTDMNDMTDTVPPVILCTGHATARLPQSTTLHIHG